MDHDLKEAGWDGERLVIVCACGWRDDVPAGVPTHELVGLARAQWDRFDEHARRKDRNPRHAE